MFHAMYSGLVKCWASCSVYGLTSCNHSASSGPHRHSALHYAATSSQVQALALLQEVGMLKGLNYDRNIVQFYGACIRQGCDPLLITEYMEGGYGAALNVRMKCATP